ncbi:hypothetical protein K435DRAFT_860386 [Dendrothele bispora CBS 962.96]|uniref:Uncharacterized protein n=1 Tax=Dendrothele bispora (strain CBS 962.96) TaxID=1314807 RepID=A0A4S8KVG3_DENBC|nr:hypothetical protein K435DRAFT_810434 [Dendrothele bispora CBS 962.96]THU94592.1 hypothetical protein K435DRAFT_860386 [Dendrothele bispora CBS 962.96]
MQFLKLYNLLAFFCTTTGVLAAPTSPAVSCARFDFRADGGRTLCSQEAAYKWDGESTTVTQGYDTSGSSCDHVLEISVAREVIKTRFCPGMDGSKTLTNQEKIASLKKLRQIINAGALPQQRNTFFITTAPEQVKGRAVETWLDSIVFKATMFVNSEKTSKRLKALYSPQKLIAVGDYLSKTEANSLKVANLIDNALAAEAAKIYVIERKKCKFSLAAGKSTKDTWGAFLEWYKEVVTAAEADMNAAAQASNSGQK